MFKAGDAEDDKVVICVEETDFICNRKKLSQHSPYFDSMFNGSFVDKNAKSVNIQLIKVNSLNHILNMTDNNSDFVSYEELLDTLQGACMLLFDNVKNYCINRLTEDLRMEYALQIWCACEELDLHPLCEKAKCKAFLEFNNIKDSDSILQLDIKQLHSYLASTFLYCDSELDVFKTAMKWWYDYSKELQTNDNEIVKYLFVILNCIDFKSVSKEDLNYMLTFPDISNNTISAILNSVLHYKDDPKSTLIPQDIENQVKQLVSINKRRIKTLLPCVLSSEFALEPDKTKRLKTSLSRDMNISYYDCQTRQMKKLFGSLNLQFGKQCTASLKGCKILPYKENLLLVGGENGSSNWNRNVWMYHTFRDQWELVTVVPEERLYFDSCIIDDKLFVIGGKAHCINALNEDMFYYDLRSGEWITNIQLPRSPPFYFYPLHICDYKNQFFIVPGNVRRTMCGYLFNSATKAWTKINITDPLKLVPNFPLQFIIFSRGNYVYIKEILGTYFIEMKLKGPEFEVQKCEKIDPLYGDTTGYYYCTSENQVFSFTNFDKIYVLQCFNIDTKTNELLIQINDSIDVLWHISRGCFPFFHYCLTETNSCISDFIS